MTCTSGWRIGGPPCEILDTGNIDTIGGCCFGNAGTVFGPTTAVTLTSPPDKAWAYAVAVVVGAVVLESEIFWQNSYKIQALNNKYHKLMNATGTHF